MGTSVRITFRMTAKGNAGPRASGHAGGACVERPPFGHLAKNRCVKVAMKMIALAEWYSHAGIAQPTTRTH